MGNKENFQNKETHLNPLIRAYTLVHEKEPEGLEDWQIAQKLNMNIINGKKRKIRQINKKMKNIFEQNFA